MIEAPASGRGRHRAKTIRRTIGRIDAMRPALIGRHACFDMAEALRGLKRIFNAPLEAWVRSIPTAQTTGRGPDAL